MWDECDQTCTNLVNSYSCQCNANYTLLPGGHCKHATSKDIIHFAKWKHLDLNKSTFHIQSEIIPNSL